jgi:hypothetical protein
LKSHKPYPQIPAETYQAARKGYNLHHAYLRIGDHLDKLLSTVDFTLLDSSASLSQDTNFRLALVTAFQYSESIADPVASEATMKRMDWKYALYLPIQHPGIPAEALSTFRHSLYASPKGLQEFGRLIARLGEFGLCPGLIERASDSVAVLNKICKITRIFRLHQAMKAALGALTACDPDWLRVHALPHWYERYKTGREYQIFQADQDAILEEALALGEDISRLLGILQQHSVPLSNLPEIHRLTWLLGEEFSQDDRGLTWRLPGYANCSCNLREEVMPARQGFIQPFSSSARSNEEVREGGQR